MSRNESVEAYGAKGMKNKPWRKTFKSMAALTKWVDANDAEVYGYGFEHSRASNESPFDTNEEKKGQA